MIPVAELMTQEHMNFSNACMALGVKFDNTAAERAAEYCEEFRNVLNAINFKFYASIGDNPLLTKSVLAGTLMTAVRRLGEMDQWDKIAVPGKLLAELMGWTEHTEDAPVIGNLTQSDIDKIRADLKAQESEVKNIVVVDGTPN